MNDKTNDPQEKIETSIDSEELKDEQLDNVQGGAVFAKYDGVVGESTTQAHSGVAYDLCDPIFRRSVANPLDLKRG